MRATSMSSARGTLTITVGRKRFRLSTLRPISSGVGLPSSMTSVPPWRSTMLNEPFAPAV